MQLLKRYRVFFMFLNDRKERALTHKEISWGAGNADGSDGRYFARYPKAAFARIENISSRLRGQPLDLMGEMQDPRPGRRCFRLPPGTDMNALLSQIEHLAGENDIFFLVIKRGQGGMAFVYGGDILPVDLATLRDIAPFLSASYRTAGRKYEKVVPEILHHILYSDGYLLRRSKMKNRK